MKYFTTLLLFSALLWSNSTVAQTKKITYVEHFSNTKCPICQDSRGDIYENLEDFKGEINHMTIHYRYPYSSCPLYQYNKTEADNRVAIYADSQDPIGSAPTLSVNGIARHRNSMVKNINAAMEDKSVPVGLNMVEKGTSSKEVTLEVFNRTEADLGHLYVYAALVEKKVKVNVDGQDWEIHDVFRKFLGSQQGKGNALGTLKSGASTSITLKGDVPNDLNAEDLYVLAWVEQRIPNGDKYELVIQNSVSVKTSVTTDTELQIPESELALYPNPARHELRLRNTSDFTPSLYRIFSSTGQEIKRMTPSGQIDISDLTPGQYILVLEGKHARVTRSFVKQ
ncbi:T9SS type A sorting domain-containing protein [Membranicola marinus]|uniref:T9SS type A sorting domain-containing protein n=1 Tax=Membranihabitans marinus TaxID=1227546 RepID=A0A953HLF4_9BACT|nr:T9SS type A sorting domain-containing protein [Membranihabitans marinus]MBY5956648.1 T9SS type A sorting domain-containing protein [Membranihabitans marinus]